MLEACLQKNEVQTTLHRLIGADRALRSPWRTEKHLQDKGLCSSILVDEACCCRVHGGQSREHCPRHLDLCAIKHKKQKGKENFNADGRCPKERKGTHLHPIVAKHNDRGQRWTRHGEGRRKAGDDSCNGMDRIRAQTKKRNKKDVQRPCTGKHRGSKVMAPEPLVEVAMKRRRLGAQEIPIFRFEGGTVVMANQSLPL